MSPTSRSAAPDVTVLLVAEGEAFAEPLATELEALGVQVELIASGENITDAFIVPPQLVVLSAATAADGGASVMAQLAQRAATSAVAVAVIGDAGAGATRIDPLASHAQMAAQIATLASERRGSRARIPLPSPGVERSVIERPRLSPSPRAPLPSPARPAVPPGAQRPSPPSSVAKPGLPKPMARPLPKPFAKTLQLTAVRAGAIPPAAAAASAFASAPPPSAAPAPPVPPPPPPSAAPPPPPSTAASPPPSTAASPSVVGPAMAMPAPPPSAALANPDVAPPPAPRTRIRHATLVGLPSPVAVIERDEASRPATPLASTLVGFPSPSADDDVSLHEAIDAPVSVPPSADLAPEAAPIAGEPTDLGIEVPELRDISGRSEPPIAGEATDAGISLPEDLAPRAVETSDFAIAFPNDAPLEVSTGETAVPSTDLPHEATPILRMAPYSAPTPSTDHRAAAPTPKARSRWPIFAAVAVVLIAGALGSGWYVMHLPVEPIVSVPVVPVVAVVASGSPPVGSGAPGVVGDGAPVPSTDPPSTDPTIAAPVVAEPVIAAPVIAEPVIAEPLIAEPVVADPAAVPPSPAGGIHLPLAADAPIEGTEAEFDLARLGVTPTVDPGGRRTTRRRIDRLLAEAYRARSRSRLDDSEEAYREVLGLDPENARALVGLSLVNADRGEHGDAVLFARRLVRLHPAYPANLVLLGERYAAGDDVASARRCFERALSIDRRHRGARAAMAALR